MSWCPSPFGVMLVALSSSILYDVRMACHVSMSEDSYAWEDCDDESSCFHVVHHDSSAEVMNSYPQEWVENLIGFSLKAIENRLLVVCLVDADDAIHSDNGPAYQNSALIAWYQHGELHREDGPAVMGEETEEWWFRNRKHRVDGPAVTYDDYEEWWLNGKLHREDGPAMLDSSGNCTWYRNGKRHRSDGPAVVTPDGKEEWWMDDVYYQSEGPALQGVDRVWYRREITLNDEGEFVFE